jgi:hypothetical protein
MVYIQSTSELSVLMSTIQITEWPVNLWHKKPTHSRRFYGSKSRFGSLVGHLMLQKIKSARDRANLPQIVWALREKAQAYSQY